MSGYGGGPSTEGGGRQRQAHYPAGRASKRATEQRTRDEEKDSAGGAEKGAGGGREAGAKGAHLAGCAAKVRTVRMFV